MKNNTKVRLHLSKQLFETLTKQVLAEAKANDGYTVAVKQPKQAKETKAQKATPEVKSTDKMKKMEEKMSSKEKMAKGLYKETDKMEENKNPEVDKAIKMLVNKLTKHFGHGDHKATIGALKAALDRLAKTHEEKKEENISNTAQMGGVTTSKGTAGYIDNTSKMDKDYADSVRKGMFAVEKPNGQVAKYLNSEKEAQDWISKNDPDGMVDFNIRKV